MNKLAIMTAIPTIPKLTARARNLQWHLPNNAQKHKTQSIKNRNVGEGDILASVHFPFRFETKTIFRYFLPGIIAFCLFLPYIRNLIPFWLVLSEVGQIGFGLFYSLVIGVILEIIIDSYARLIFKRLLRLELFAYVFRLDCPEQILEDLECSTISVVPPELHLDISPPNRELIWHTTAVAHMLVGCAIVFSFYGFVSLLGLSLINSVQVLFTSFSILMGYTCLRGGMTQARLRNQYIRTLRARAYSVDRTQRGKIEKKLYPF